MATITITGSEQTYPCASGDTLLRAALRAGIGMAYECNAGACGTCKIDLVSGQVHDLYPDAPGIRQRDRDRGRHLACQSAPLGDCTVKARLNPCFVSLHAPRRQSATLRFIRDLTHDIREFSFAADGEAGFRPGQYAMLSLPAASAPRAYSMSNNANADGDWRFMIRRTPEGAVSNGLFGLRLGQEIELDGPYGLAYLREDSERDIVCVAGGSGIAPMVSILDAAGAQARAARVGAWFFYGGRSPADVPAIAELLKPSHFGDGLQWHPVVSVPALGDGSDWAGERGFVHELLPKKLPKPLREYEYYFAGPPPMVEATVRLLVAEHKVASSQLHFDRFF